MKSSTTKLLFYLIPFGLLVYVLNHYLMPSLGMVLSTVLSALLTLILLVIYIIGTSREGDERERFIQLQADSAALYSVIAGLLLAAIFDPHSQLAMVFWMVLGLAVIGRIIAFLYHRYK